jgi:hypothetical protein
VSAENEEPRAEADMADVARRVDESWHALQREWDGVPESRLEDAGVAGEWSLKHLFGHLAFWDKEAIEEIRRALNGEPRADSEWQRLNDEDHAARRGRTLAEERAEMARAHAALVARIQELDDADAAKIDTAVRPGSYGHYEEHIQDIRAWRQRQGL